MDAELELDRQQEELLWVGSFLRTQQRCLSQVDFLALWATQLKVRKRKTGQQDVPAGIREGKGEKKEEDEDEEDGEEDSEEDDAESGVEGKPETGDTTTSVLEDIFPDMDVEGSLTIVDSFQAAR